MNAQDRRLGRIDDGRRQHRAEHAAIRDRIRSAGQLLHLELALLRALAEVRDLLFYFRDGELIRVAHDRNDQPARAADRDAYVEITVIDDVAAIDRRVDDGEFF